MPMGRKLVVGGKLEAEGKRYCFVLRAFNYGNFRTSRQRRHICPFQISRHDHYVIGMGWVLRPCSRRAESSKSQGKCQ